MSNRPVANCAEFAQSCHEQAVPNTHTAHTSTRYEPLTPDDLARHDEYSGGQATMRRREREEALETVRAGRVFKYCPTAPGERVRVLWLHTEEHVARVLG